MRIFDEERLRNQIAWIKKQKYTYVLGVDTVTNDNEQGYCLMRYTDGKDPVVILSKNQMKKTPDTFDSDIKVLAEHFNAIIIYQE